jgi:ABC-2 type transport system ATP-binding protein
MNILDIENLTKSFGMLRVIDGLTLSVPEHSIFGFIGQNGAGKTTTMKMVLGLLKPTSGTISVCGEPVTYGQTKTNKYVGYLPDVPEFYGYMKPFEYLRLCGKITGLPDTMIKGRTEELLTLVGLDKANKKIGGFSRGMKQRLGIAQALINQPKLLICDEPTSALDPVGRKEILDIIYQVKDKTTVVFSTHILSDVERICDNIALLHKGKLALCGTLQDIKSKYRHDSFFIEFSSPEEKRQFMSAQQLGAYKGNIQESDTSITFHTKAVEQAELAVITVLAEKHLHPLKFEVLEPTLENLFIEVVK